MGVLATDDFNRANSASLGANWANVTGLNQADLQSNAAANSNANNIGARYTAVAAPADQYSKVTCTVLNSSTSTGVGAAVRMASGAVTLYLIQGNTTETTMFKGVGGSFTQLGSTAAASAVNDILEISAVGTTITGKKNGAVIIGPVTDAAIASGDYGLWFTGVVNTLRADNWEGGNFADSNNLRNALKPYPFKPSRGGPR